MRVRYISMYKYGWAAVPIFILLAVGRLAASSSLFYIEAQGVAGYSSGEKKAIFYSMHQDDAMQKPSIGIDYIQKFSAKSGDIASLAVQMRMAFDQTKKYNGYIEPQLYNAYLKFKTPFMDILGRP